MEIICTEYRHAAQKDLQKREIWGTSKEGRNMYSDKLVPVPGVTLKERWMPARNRHFTSPAWDGHPSFLYWYVAERTWIYEELSLARREGVMKTGEHGSGGTQVRRPWLVASLLDIGVLIKIERSLKFCQLDHIYNTRSKVSGSSEDRKRKT